MKIKTAGELMIPLDKYPHIPYWFTIREAIAIIHNSELEINSRRSLARAVLVFDKEYKLLGMIRRRDILSGLDPEDFLHSRAKYSKKLFDVETDPNLLEMSYENLMSSVKKNAVKQVSEIMQPIGHTVLYDDHILKVIHEMDALQTSVVPVMKDNAVVGVVRTIEVLNEVMNLLDI